MAVIDMMMHGLARRTFLVQCASLPLILPLIGCSIRPLAPLVTTPVLAPNKRVMRPPQVGQSWQYKKINQFNSEPIELIDETIASIDLGQVGIVRKGQTSQALGNELHSPWGQILADSDWDFNQTYTNPIPMFLDLNVINTANRIQTHYQVGSSSYRLPIMVNIRQYGWERVVIPSGEFIALRIEKLIRFQHNDPIRMESFRVDRYWFVPEIGRWVVRETDGRYFYISGRRRVEGREDYLRYELTSWTQPELKK